MNILLTQFSWGWCIFYWFSEWIWLTRAASTSLIADHVLKAVRELKDSVRNKSLHNLLNKKIHYKTWNSNQYHNIFKHNKKYQYWYFTHILLRFYSNSSNSKVYILHKVKMCVCHVRYWFLCMILQTKKEIVPVKVEICSVIRSSVLSKDCKCLDGLSIL